MFMAKMKNAFVKSPLTSRELRRLTHLNTLGPLSGPQSSLSRRPLGAHPDASPQR